LVAARAPLPSVSSSLASIVERFGAGVLQADGQLDRSALRQLIFADPAQRKWLEQLLHPLIGQEIFSYLAKAESPYAVYVSPLLIESGQYQKTQRVLVIDAPQELQVARTLARDNTSAEQVQAILKAQLAREERLRHADDVVVNDGDLAALHQQIDRLHHFYLTLRGGQP